MLNFICKCLPRFCTGSERGFTDGLCKTSRVRLGSSRSTTSTFIAAVCVQTCWRRRRMRRPSLSCSPRCQTSTTWCSRSCFSNSEIHTQARSKQCMIGPAEINIKLPVGGLGRAASPPAGSGAEPREPNAFQKKYNENGFK